MSLHFLWMLRSTESYYGCRDQLTVFVYDVAMFCAINEECLSKKYSIFHPFVVIFCYVFITFIYLFVFFGHF